MRKNKKVILMAAASMLFASVGMTQAADKKLTVWSLNYTATKQTKSLDLSAKEFEASHPGVAVEFVKRATDEHKVALRVAAGSDKGPDIYVFWAGLGLGGEYVQAGLSTDLTKYFEKYGWADRLSIPSQAWVKSFADGMHGMPYRFSGEAVYYNKTLFKQAGIESEPQTYDELLDAAKKLKAAGIPAFTFGGTVNWHVMRLMDVLLETKCGVEMHDKLKAMEANWSTTPCAEAAFTEMKMWADEYFLKPFMGIDHRQSGTLFFSNRAAMMLEGDWHVNAINENADISNYGIFPFPTGTGRLYGFGEYMYISSKTKQAALAAEFLNMFSGKEFQEKISGAFGALSVNKEVELSDKALGLHKEWLEIFANAKGTFVNGDQAFPLDTTTEYFRIINELASGNFEPKAAADAMATFIKNRS